MLGKRMSKREGESDIGLHEDGTGQEDGIITI